MATRVAPYEIFVKQPDKQDSIDRKFLSCLQIRELCSANTQLRLSYESHSRSFETRPERVESQEPLYRLERSQSNGPGSSGSAGRRALPSGAGTNLRPRLQFQSHSR